MTQKEKRFEKLLKNPKESNITEIHTILNDFGFKLISVKGSHHKYYRPGIDPIVIPIHNNKVKKCYVKNVNKALTKF